jgi:hypothetical protein
MPEEKLNGLMIRRIWFYRAGGRRKIVCNHTAIREKVLSRFLRGCVVLMLSWPKGQLQECSQAKGLNLRAFLSLPYERGFFIALIDTPWQYYFSLSVCNPCFYRLLPGERF